MADTKEKDPAKEAGKTGMWIVLIIIAIIWLVTHKSTVKTFWEDHKSLEIKDHIEMVDVEVGKVSREIRTDPKKEWLDFDIMNSNLSWYVIVNGDVEGKILIEPGGPINKLGRGIYKLQFMLAENAFVDSKISVHHIPK